MTNSDGYVNMWHIMEALQTQYLLTQQMISAILRSDPDNSLPGSNGPKKILEQVKNLLEKGADADGMPGASMLRPLHAAAKTGNPEIVKLLYDAGADVNTMDACNSRTPLHYSAETSADTTKILLKYGAFPDSRDGDGNTPLHWASYKNKHECVKYLLQHKASVNAINLNSDSPLGFAAMRGNGECVRLLLDHGADVTLRNYSGKTPLIRAAALQYSDFNSYGEDVSFDLLLRASGRLILKGCEMYEEETVLNSDKDIYRFLSSIASQVSPLASLCRASVRQQLVNRYLPDAVNSLRLPKDIKRFLLLLDKR